MKLGQRLQQYRDDARKRPVLWSGPVMAGGLLQEGVRRDASGQFLAATALRTVHPGIISAGRNPAAAGFYLLDRENLHSI